MSKKKPIEVVFAHLGKYRADGMADTDNRVVEIDKRLRGFRRLEVIIHEVIHIQNPKWPEIMVEGKAKEIATVLWSMDYRHVDQ